jgi:pimeloyl-ACP methyl ester carboxylesterase
MTASAQARLEVLEARPASAAAAPPVVFAHGARHAAWCWAQHFLPYFAEQGFHAIAPSFSGHGKSDGRHELNTLTLDHYREDLREVLSGLRTLPVLVGHSMGGAVVQRLLQAAPDCARAVVLLASVPPGGVTRCDDWWFRLTHTSDFLAMREHARSRSNKPFPWRMLFAESLDSATRDYYLSQLQPESPVIHREIRKPIVTRRLNRHVPILVLGAARDRFISRAALRRTAAWYGVPCSIMDGAHDLMLDPCWRSSADAIVAFIAREVGR